MEKENQCSAVKPEADVATPTAQQPGRLRRLSSLQAITNFTKEAFARRKSTKLVDSPLTTTRTPSSGVKSSLAENMRTPTAVLAPNVSTPITVIRTGMSERWQPCRQNGMKMARSKTTSFLPVLSKAPSEISKVSALSTSSRKLQPQSTINSDVTYDELPLSAPFFSHRGILTEGTLHGPTGSTQHCAFAQTLSSKPHRYSAVPSKPTSHPTWEAHDHTLPFEPPRLRLLRSRTQPNLPLPAPLPTLTGALSPFPGHNIFRVNTAMPLEYWAGRFTSLRDQLRSSELTRDLPTNAAMAAYPDSPGARMSREEKLVREIFTVLYLSCDSEGASETLKVFQMVVATDYHLPNLRFFCPPWQLPEQQPSSGSSTGSNENKGLVSKRSFMERLLSSRSGKKAEGGPVEKGYGTGRERDLAQAREQIEKRVNAYRPQAGSVL